MQITEQIIERIARRTFNSMFAPALRQSNVVTSGSGSSVSWADNAGHANSADAATTAGSATTAGTASAAPWSGITGKPATATRWPSWSEVTNKPSTFAPSAHTHDYIVPKSTITYGANYLQYDDVYATEASNPANAIGNPTADWYHHIVMNHANAGGYFVDMALCFHNNYFYYRRIANGVASDWVRVIDSSNISTQSVASATKATQDGDGNVIKNTYLKLSGGTMTGALTLNASQYAGYMTGSSRTYAMNANNSDIVGINALIMSDKSDGWTESIGFPRDGSDAGHYDTFRAANGTFYFGFNGYYDSSNVEHAAAELVTITGSAIQLARTDSNNAELRVKNSGRDLSLFAGTTNIGMYYNTGSKWIIGTDGSNTWLSTGNVGIGTVSPSQKLHVSGGLLAITNNSRTVTIGAQNNGAIHIYNDNSSPFFFNGDVCSNASKTYDLGSSTYPWGTLYAAGCNIYDTSPSVHVGTSSSARISLHWSSDSNRGLYDYTGNWVVATNGTNTFMMKGNVGIGTTSPSYKLHVSGQIYCTGGFTFLSDERKKNIIDHDVKLSVADIANAPLIHYTLKDDPEKRVRVGSIAQYWKKVLPESVNHAEDGTLSMNYDLQAHASVIVLARKVRELEQIIYNLQSRIV